MSNCSHTLNLGLVATVLLVVASLAIAQESPSPPSDADLRAHLDSLAKKVDDVSITLANRERIAQEMAASLDRAAATAPNAGLRRAYWAEAAKVLDDFSARNAAHPLSQSFRVQASVYLWARARTWLQAFETNPTDEVSRAGAVKDLNEAAERFKAVLQALAKDAKDVFAQNVRYRTAQALADLGEVLPDEAARASKNAEALQAIEPGVTEESLAGFVHLLRAELHSRLGAFEKAKVALTAAEASKPPPPPADLLDTRLDLLLGSGEYEAALKAVEAAPIDAKTRPALRVRVRLTERSGTANIGRRNAAETALFKDLAVVRDSGRGDARAALISATRSMQEPSAEQDPLAWDLLAAGAILLGDPARAGSLEQKGAARAGILNNPTLANELALRAGAYYFQADRFGEADLLLTRIVDNPDAGPIRARAGMLRILSRGRALALKQPGASEASYSAALKHQIKNFPDDASTAEARWLLGKLKMADSDRAGAVALWKAITHGQPRWLDSVLEVASLSQTSIDNFRINGERAEVDKVVADARSFLAKSLETARGETEINELLLAIARLELTPKMGKTPEALAALDRVQKSAATPAQHEATRRMMILALATANRWVEVEQLARAEAQKSAPASVIGLVRLIDRAAAESDTDLKSRRLGLVSRLLLSRAVEQSGELDPPLRAEVHLRQIRALLFSGDEAGARRLLMNSGQPLPTRGDADLRDLAETYMKLGAFDLALDVNRLRAKSLPPGSLSWFETRYALALAAYRAGKPTEAIKLIDGTSILHPDLGGGELREKFLHLRRRIGPTGP